MEQREIKFRAWCSGKHEGLSFHKPHMDYDVTISPRGNWCSVKSSWDIQGEYPSVPVMQYTGLKDKNGKEIYEGDIIQFDFGKDSKEGVLNTLVVFDSGMFCYEPRRSKQVIKGDKWNMPHDYIDSNWWNGSTYPLRSGFYGKGDCEWFRSSSLIEIIGNIYENPELIR